MKGMTNVESDANIERIEQKMEIKSHTIELVEDPFGILSGNRYELFLHIEIPEDDELFSEKGLKIKVLLIEDEKGYHLSHYHIIEAITDRILDFELDEDEEQLIEAYCIEQAKEYQNAKE
ncbi:hypothetical protein J27TS8_09180 [Robertmurraya siralis]|uniref:Pullulanase n=1 Tax=Robertmurraya siralis TaxID=77777 RepID=A0A919WFG0_9BACI|nr:DUF6509 family protein [Robertmurraya siralis]GIN60925.1 hypothetical protein J27TS8_09180 [Robertmurraya siralis]